jgi:hypothetical protein
MIYNKPDKVTKKDACKIVICNVTENYLVKLLNKFPEITTIKKLHDIKNNILKGHCGNHVSRQNLAGAIFHTATGIKWKHIINTIGGNAVTMRKYEKWLDLGIIT